MSPTRKSSQNEQFEGEVVPTAPVEPVPPVDPVPCLRSGAIAANTNHTHSQLLSRDIRKAGPGPDDCNHDTGERHSEYPLGFGSHGEHCAGNLRDWIAVRSCDHPAPYPGCIRDHLCSQVAGKPPSTGATVTGDRHPRDLLHPGGKCHLPGDRHPGPGILQ